MIFGVSATAIETACDRNSLQHQGLQNGREAHDLKVKTLLMRVALV